jgi:hypothetical protein
MLIVILGAVAFFTRDTWLPRVTGNPPSAPVTWESVSDPGAKKGEDALAALQRPGGPAYVTLTAAELAALMVESADHRLPQALDSVQAAIDGEIVRVRALVKLDDIRGLDALGPLSGILNTQERIEFSGTLAVVESGLGEFRVATVKIGDLALPRAAIPRLIARLDKTARPAGIAPDGIAIGIPGFIGDVRVARGQVTLYRRTP